jgi:negative regulator of flagellin synthesis FlgM
MVESVGGKPLSVQDRSLSRVDRMPAVRPPETPVLSERQAATPAIRPLARELAASPPVDADRVARIRKAIQEGRFPITPATIADNLLALKLDWLRNDEA